MFIISSSESWQVGIHHSKGSYKHMFSLNRLISQGASLVFIALCTLLVAWNTYPQAPKPKPRDKISEQNPGAFVPYEPEKFTWVISDRIGGEKTSANGEVPVYQISTLGERRFIGTIASGVSIQLDKFRDVQEQIYYAIPREIIHFKDAQTGATETAKAAQQGTNDPLKKRAEYWVCGDYIKASASK